MFGEPDIVGNGPGKSWGKTHNVPKIVFESLPEEYGDHEQGGPYRRRKMGLEEEHATDIRERWRRAIGEAKTSLGTNGHGSKEVFLSKKTLFML